MISSLGGRSVSGSRSRTRFTMRMLLSSVVVCGLGFAAVSWCFREVGRSRWYARGSACRGNLHYIGMALRNYHETYGSFPPAYTVNKNGKPLCSWRVLLTASDPSSSHIYNSYNFNEPWNGPNNRKLAVLRPTFYSCKNDSAQQSDSLCTSYVAIVGPGATLQGGEPFKMADPQCRQNQIILIAEVADSGINWMEPRDLDVSRMSFLLNDPSRPSISSRDSGGPGVLFADGQVDRLDPSITRDALKTMTTFTGGGAVR